MTKIKTFFLLALSFFLSAAGYRLLAERPAHAQSGLTLDLDELELGYGLIYSGVLIRTIYTATSPWDRHYQPLNFYTYPPVPGTTRVIAANWIERDDPQFFAMLENGEACEIGSTLIWSYPGNILSGASIGAQHGTWGLLKARYAQLPEQGGSTWRGSLSTSPRLC